jgi:transaldolase
MIDSYFTRLKSSTPTRVWVNNPTAEEMALALAQGAAGCTTNPSYCGGLLKRSPEAVLPVIDAMAKEGDDAETAAAKVQLALVKRIVDGFRPLFDATAGAEGYVSCQGAPEGDTDTANILAEAHAARAVGPNCVPKIPATRAGLTAFETLVAEGSPTIVTEVFSLAQLIETNERFLAASSRAGVRPPFFISPISGIFGDYLKAVSERDGLDVDPSRTEIAGMILARACYEVCLERNYSSTLLVGGARIPFDILGLVGSKMHATINWSTFAEILAQEPAPTASFADPIAPEVTRELERTFPEVAAALRVDGLALDEFEKFGPVLFFRDKFVEGWHAVRDSIAEVRANRGR